MCALQLSSKRATGDRSWRFCYCPPQTRSKISQKRVHVSSVDVFEHNVQILSKSSSGDVHIEAKVPLVWGDKNPSALGAPHGPVKLERPRTRHRERANSVVENREHSENRCPPR